MNTTNQTNDPPHTPYSVTELQELEQLHSKATALHAYAAYIVAACSALPRLLRELGEAREALKRINDSALDAQRERDRAISDMHHALASREKYKAEVVSIHAQLATVTNDLATASKERDEAIDERDKAEEWADDLAEATGDVGEHSNSNNPWARGIENIEALQARVATLEQELQEARRDTQRLDWLENNGANGLLIGGVCYWSVTKGHERIGEGDDLRAAIDAAARKGDGQK
jgi:seryl-tRNA synthetase